MFLSVSETCPNGFFLGGRCEVRRLAFGGVDDENEIREWRRVMGKWRGGLEELVVVI